VWAQQRVPSGIAALLVATLPLWMVSIDALRPRGRRPSSGVIAGLVLGIIGIVVLVGPGAFAGSGRVDPIGAAVLMAASLFWAAGSIYSRSAPHPPAPLLSTGMQMLAGGAGLLLAGAVHGELAQLGGMRPSTRSVLAMSYLIVFGSLVGFTAYVWLLRVSTPAKVATYAYVNPVVAVFLGWALAGEPVTRRTLIAAAVIVGAVALITTAQTARREALHITAETPVPDDTRPASGRA
jgi:drug/metabolite transporter (DMT)-like permease